VKTLALVAGSAVPSSLGDAAVVAWDEAAERALRGRAVAVRTVAQVLGPEAAEEVDTAAVRWTKEWGRRPLLDGCSFRDLYDWKGVSLWWFAELFLHHSTEATRFVRVVETVHRLLDAEAPDEMEAHGLPEDEALLAARTCLARGVLFHGGAVQRTPRRGVSGVRRRARWNAVKAWATAAKAAASGPAPAPGPGAPVALFLSHAAFWRERTSDAGGAPRAYEHYFDRLIPALGADDALRPFVVAVGPRAAFRRRGLGERLADWLHLHGDGEGYVHVNRYFSRQVARETRRGTALAARIWKELSGRAAVRETFSHRGVTFADLSEADLAATLLLQLPWAIRSYEEMAAVLEAVRPAVVCLYAESSGWGRAALAACRAAQVPAVAVQHGIVYANYYSYVHDLDEAACPRPARTAVFGEEARRLLLDMGHYPAHELVMTGSPKLDQLQESARTWDAEATRAMLAVPAGEPLVVVASRFRGIRRTHQSIGSALPELLRALEALGVRTVIKPHPAEGAEDYARVLRETGVTRARVVPAGADLLRLLHAADALVTVESLAAVEALVLERPVVVVNAPTNLRAMVEAGVALGVPVGADPTDALRRALFDDGTREALRAARARYRPQIAYGDDGGATARIVTLVRSTAGLPVAGAAAAAGGHGRVKAP
jgi:CDP-Glycerol:Poly(glycerophosphate) glycerophosphotransferase